MLIIDFKLIFCENEDLNKKKQAKEIKKLSDVKPKYISIYKCSINNFIILLYFI